MRFIEGKLKNKCLDVCVFSHAPSEGARSFTMDIRYVDDKGNTHTEFLELIECAGNAESMTYAFLSVLGPDLLQKLIGGAFDGASSMMGAKGGVQKKLQEYAPFARFIHCVCHHQALLGAAAVDGSPEIAAVHSALQKIYALFARSGIRLEKLH
eukprot:COSAG06_NODE_34242_length_477_cov_1.224868_1_plen_153_part_10